MTNLTPKQELLVKKYIGRGNSYEACQYTYYVGKGASPEAIMGKAGELMRDLRAETESED